MIRKFTTFTIRKGCKVELRISNFLVSILGYTLIPPSFTLKETCLGVEGTNSNGVAGGINGELGSNGDLVGGNGGRLRVDSTVVGGDREVLGGGNGVLRGGNGVLRSNTGFVSI